LPAFEGLNDEHGGATVRADIGGRVITAVYGISTVHLCISGLVSFFTHQYFTGTRQVVLSCGVGDQSVVPDAVEARYAPQRITGFM